MKVDPLQIALSQIVNEIDAHFKMKLSKSDHETMAAIIAGKIETIKHTVYIPASIHKAPVFEKLSDNYRMNAVKKMADYLKKEMVEAIRPTELGFNHNYEIYILQVGKNESVRH